MKGQNTTVVSVFYDEEMLFCTNSFPVIPEVDEVISVREDDISKRYVVTKREFIYQKHSDSDDRGIFVILHVSKPSFVD